MSRQTHTLTLTSAIARIVILSILVPPRCDAFSPLINPETVSPFGLKFFSNPQRHNLNQSLLSLVPIDPAKRLHNESSKIHRVEMVSDSTNYKNPLFGKGLITILSTSSLILIDFVFRRLLKYLSISFPSPLAGCGVLLTTLLAASAINEEWGDFLYRLLAPGAATLAKWLPVCLVPNLVILPLAKSLGSSTEIMKVAGTIIAGFCFTLFTTAYSVTGVRKLTSGHKIKIPSIEPTTIDNVASQVPPKKAFSDNTFQFLSASAIVGGLVSILASCGGVSPLVATPLQAFFMLFTTLSTFVFGARLPISFTKHVHPLVTCTSLTWLGAKFIGACTKNSFFSMLRSYKCGTLCPVHLGAGDLLLFMVGPAVIALACQMFDRKKLIRENITEIATAVTVSSVGSLFGTAALVRSLGMKNPALRLCMMSRNVTSALAMAIAGIFGADASVSVSVAIVTGLIGANFGASILDAAGIKDAVARGMGIGAASHGLGAAAFVNEEDAFPFAAIAMALTASTSTLLVSVPVIKNFFVKIALGT